MDVRFLDELLNDIKDHADELQECAMKEAPDLDRIEYHHVRLLKKVERVKGVATDGR